MTLKESNAKTYSKYVYLFGSQLPQSPLDETLLGCKGKNLVEMASMGIRVPSGIIITTEACNKYRINKLFPNGLEEDVLLSLKILGELLGEEFGNVHLPLLVSIRSGARIPMPGMMDSILNLGINDLSVLGLAKVWQNERLAYDCYRRLIMMYGEVVKGINHAHFEQAIKVLKMEEEVELDIDLSVQNLKKACEIFKKIYREYSGVDFPQDSREQLFSAISSVFNSWDSERALLYRKLNHIPDDFGTAVIIQTMVFGNKNNRSATGIAFTRDPTFGKNNSYGEFLTNAQGEDLVSGVRTPHPLNNYSKKIGHFHLDSLEDLMPETYEQLRDIVKNLENHYRDAQEIEFTIDDGNLYILQTHGAKRTGFAAIRMAIEMLHEGLIDEKMALKRIEPEQLIQLLTPIFDTATKAKAQEYLVAKGLKASPGAASGKLALSLEKALEWKNQGIAYILVRKEARPHDLPGMVGAEGLLTLHGGSTSHAAVVARGMGKPCIVGCEGLFINEENKSVSTHNKILHEGDFISIDGLTGEVFFCALPTIPSEVIQVLITKTKKAEDSLLFRQYEVIMRLANKYRRLKIRGNANNLQDSLIAKAFGAEGIGLFRTEDMFRDINRLNDIRCLFFNPHIEDQKKAINRLVLAQKNDFVAIFKVMDGLPVTIRLLDSSLHEFIPQDEVEIKALALSMNMPKEKLMEIRSSIEEENPALGYRGCRLGISYPELTIMQTRAILEAALEVTAEGIKARPEILIPFVSVKNELVHQKALIIKTAQEVFFQREKSVEFAIGAMIELPHSALIADQIALEAQFFSFETNDLTQTTFGISRNDSAKFVPLYLKGVNHPFNPEDTLQLLPVDPFQVIDREGVGQLMEIAIQKGRQVRPDLFYGICGEQGGDSSSVQFFHEIGLDYVSCSPYRVPIASLAAAIANLDEN